MRGAVYAGRMFHVRDHDRGAAGAHRRPWSPRICAVGTQAFSEARFLPDVMFRPSFNVSLPRGQVVLSFRPRADFRRKESRAHVRRRPRTVLGAAKCISALASGNGKSRWMHRAHGALSSLGHEAAPERESWIGDSRLGKFFPIIPIAARYS